MGGNVRKKTVYINNTDSSVYKQLVKEFYVFELLICILVKYNIALF